MVRIVERGTVPLMDQDLYYGSYLRLDKLLDAQELESAKAGSTVHDEMLFIVVHQAYELWFKQILWEMDEVRRVFGQAIVDEADMGTAVSLLRRITEIQKLLIQQVSGAGDDDSARFPRLPGLSLPGVGLPIDSVQAGGEQARPSSVKTG